MEENDTLKLGLDPDVLSKRRISSILKAPRTSMKVCRDDQDDNQQENRPTEKRRNSRRVSFATTNNVHVFSKDTKTPVLTPIHNSDVVGLDAVLDIPLNVSLIKKGNFFPDPVLQDDHVDRTIFLGDDTGIMDLTHSDTIIIDRKNGIDPQFCLTTGGNVTGHHAFKDQTDMPCKASASLEKDAAHSDFSAFLASISSQSVSETFKKKSLDLLELKDTSEEGMDKENVLPSVFNKQVHCPVNSQPKGFKSKHSASMLLEEDHMDMTKSHTVVVDMRKTAQCAPYSACENHSRNMSSVTQLFSNGFDDMEITQTQTANINTKPLENLALTMHQDDTSGMIITEVFDEYIQEQETQATRDKVFPFIQANRTPSFNQPNNVQMFGQNRVDFRQSNISFAPTDHFDDMEITQSQTAVLETKSGEESFCKPRNVLSVAPTFYRNDAGDKMGGFVVSEPDRTAADAVFYNDQSDFMELTCQPNTATLVMSPNADDMELTECDNVAINTQSILATCEKRSRKRASFMLPPSVSSEVRKAGHFQNDVLVDHVLDDMEMTQCQTAVLDTKCLEYQPFRKTRKSVSLTSVPCELDVTDRKAMDVAHQLTGHISLKRFSSSERKKPEICVKSPTAQKHQYCDLPVCVDMCQSKVSVSPATDMERTGYYSAATDKKSTWLERTSSMAQKTPCVRSSESTLLDTDPLEMSKVISDKPVKGPPTLSTDSMSPVAAMVVGAENPVGNQKESVCYLADVEYKNYDASHVSHVMGSQPLNTGKNVESSEEHCNMELTEAFTTPLEEQCKVTFNQEEMTKESLGTMSGTTDHKTDQGCALPENKTTVTDVKTGLEVESDMDPVNTCDDPVRLRRKSLVDLQVQLGKIAQRINVPTELVTGSATAPGEPFIGSERCLVNQNSERQTEPLRELPNVKNKVTPAQNNGFTTTSNLKNAVTPRLSLGGIMPKLTPRTKSANPNHLEPKRTNNTQKFHMATHLDMSLIDIIGDEVFPEGDFSDILVSGLINEKDKQKTSTGERLHDNFESDVNIIQCEKTREVGDTDVRKGQEASGQLWHSDSTAVEVQNAPSLITKMIDDTCSSSNTSSTKCDGISESTLRNSHLDSQIDGTVDHEFDFNKKLEDGSITVNELLSHFGVSFVIHKSRPSALPDNFRAAQTHTMVDLLREKYIHRPKQRVYESDCQKLTEMAEGLKIQMAEQDKPLRSINEALLQDLCGFSKLELQKFGARLKERRVYFRKRSKALSHEMKKDLYSELLKTTQEAKLKLMDQINEVNEMIKDLDGCASDLESELAAVNDMIMRDQDCVLGTQPSLNEKQEEVDALNSVVAEREKQIGELEYQRVSLEQTQKKLQDETRCFESRITILNSLNEWRFNGNTENGAIFTFLHDTVQLEVKLKKACEKAWVREDEEEDMDIYFRFLLNDEKSQSHASMVHKLLASYTHSQTKWTQKYPTSRHIPMLLHDVSLVVSRLRLLGEEIHRLKKWGGLRLGILHIDCVDTLVEITFSSVKAFAKFDLSLAVSSDYPFGSLQVEKFKNHIGSTSVDQIEGIISSVTPAKGYLTNVIKRIHAEYN